jgi:hypothetical protein
MNPDIERIIGSELQTKVVDLLERNFEGIYDMIENRFNEMKESHKKDKEEII